MQTPAPSHRDDDLPGDSGWPRPQPRPRPRPVLAPPHPAPAPARRRRPRSRLDVAWVTLALLGLAAAAAAAIWYLTLRRSPPSVLTVPRVVGLRESLAVRRLTSEGFGVREIDQPGAARSGVVFAQTPSAGAELGRGTMVTIRVSNGQKP